MQVKHVFWVGGVGAVALILGFNVFGAREAVFNRLDASPPPADGGQGETPPPEAGSSSDAAESAPHNSGNAPLPVSGFLVRPAPFVETVHASGRAEARRRAELAPRVGERVTAVNVREGASVRAGQSLVELDPQSFEIALKEAEAAYANAEVDAQVKLLNDPEASAEKRDLVAHRSGLTAAEQSVARAKLDLERSRIVAPFAGEVAWMGAEVGQQALAGTPVVTVVDASRLRIKAEVLEPSFGAVSTGRSATLTFPAFPDERFQGTITALSPEIDPVRGTGVAFIEIENADRRLRPGMYAEVRIEAASHDDRLAVPRVAVLERDRRLLVFVARNGRAEWQYVETGLENDDWIEITRGVGDGDTVLVEGHLTLAHGAPIQITLGTR